MAIVVRSFVGNIGLVPSPLRERQFNEQVTNVTRVHNRDEVK